MVSVDMAKLVDAQCLGHCSIPPLIGFFAKQIVLYSSMHSGYYFMSIVAIVVSVISASYYLKIIQVIYFGSLSHSIIPTSFGAEDERFLSGNNVKSSSEKITNIHSVIVSVLTIIILLFIFQPIILLNSCHLLALSIFYY
ncbi:UNVERIFIED_CONTAM: NADH-ubiquinone oxidoreductase chain 2 [Trichonephila clavipes]